MKCAFIPPTKHLKDIEITDIHLCLAQQLQDTDYVGHYWTRSKLGDYIILDNGAHEKFSYQFPQMLAMGALIGASEVVIPDHPHDPIGTWVEFRKVIEALEQRKSLRELWQSCNKPRLMFVPQVPHGERKQYFDQYISLANRMFEKAMMSTEHADFQYTMGIPLMYDVLPGGIFALVDRISWLVEDTGFDVHLLGWSRNLKTPIDVANDFPGVRSCDTAKPFVYAQAGIDMYRAAHEDWYNSYPGRPDDYFNMTMTPQELELAQHNVHFCIKSLEIGRMPELPEQSYVVSAASEQDKPSDSPGLPDDTRSEEGTPA